MYDWIECTNTAYWTDSANLGDSYDTASPEAPSYFFPLFIFAVAIRRPGAYESFSKHASTRIPSSSLPLPQVTVHIQSIFNIVPSKCFSIIVRKGDCAYTRLVHIIQLGHKT